MMMKVDIVLLAAGSGSRMQSPIPKVLHCIAGKPIILHIIETLNELNNTVNININIVVSEENKTSIQNALQQKKQPIKWIVQKEQLGTGHAVQQALPYLSDANIILVMYADVPLINVTTLKKLIITSQETHLSLLTAVLSEPSGYGRIIRNSKNQITGIIEHKDASEAQRSICEINTGIMVIPSLYIHKWLDALQVNNLQKEYYLTDIIALAAEDQILMIASHPSDIREIQGINDKIQLNLVERYYQEKQAKDIMKKGVTLADPARIDIRGDVKVGKAIFIDTNVILEGHVILGDHVTIETGCIIRDAHIQNNVIIKAYSILEEVNIGTDCIIGPFARLRPGTCLAQNVKIGNFVETKKAYIDKNSKVNHLSYIGDASIATNVNIGAGTITCNYDSKNKFKTTIKNNVFIGSNSALIAPVTIDDNATIAAGSVITKKVEKNQLGIARGRQKNKSNWKRPDQK